MNNSHHHDQVTLSEVEDHLQNPPDELKKVFVYPHKSYFVVDSILEFDKFTRKDLSFKDTNQVNEIMQLIKDLSNNIRLRENNGHTPQEIFEQFGKPKLRPLPAEPF